MKCVGRKLTEFKSQLAAVEKKIADREKHIMPIYHQVYIFQYIDFSSDFVL